MQFRPATLDDFDAVVAITTAGREFLASQGLDQWQGGNPSPERVREDIERGYDYLAVDVYKRQLEWYVNEEIQAHSYHPATNYYPTVDYNPDGPNPGAYKTVAGLEEVYTDVYKRQK